MGEDFCMQLTSDLVACYTFISRFNLRPSITYYTVAVKSLQGIISSWHAPRITFRCNL
jgi:hypothetical protein